VLVPENMSRKEDGETAKRFAAIYSSGRRPNPSTLLRLPTGIFDFRKQKAAVELD
jgi:hypothetical protein